MDHLPLTRWFVVLHILGAVQGLFLAALLVSRRYRSVANTLLAATMLAFGVDLGMAVYHATGSETAFPHLIGLDYPLALLYGPLLYLYTRVLAHPRQAFDKAYLWHFLPFALLVMGMLPFYLKSGADKLAVLHAQDIVSWADGLMWVNHFKLVHALAYIGGIVVVLRRHRVRIRSHFASPERLNLTWLRHLLVGIVALTGTVVVLYLLALREPAPVIGMNPATMYDDYSLLGVVLFVYTIGFMGLRQPEILGTRPLVMPTQGSAPTPRYAKSGMDPDTASHHKQALQTLMEAEKPYRRGDLTLQDLADALAISSHNLTEVLSTQFEQSFYDFVNAYRVREVQQRLADPQSAHLTLLAVGLEAGFNSKSSFNSVFKKHTGMTPSQYRTLLVAAS